MESSDPQPARPKLRYPTCDWGDLIGWRNSCELRKGVESVDLWLDGHELTGCSEQHRWGRFSNRSLGTTVRSTGLDRNSNRTLKRIILLTDGEHNTGSCPLKVASRLKSAGVVIDCIGIGGSPHDVDEKLLKSIASRNPNGSIRYCFIGDKHLLLKKYESLARHIRPA